jgi:hypothetical protein
MELTTEDGKTPGLQLTRAHRNLADKHYAVEREMDKRQTLEATLVLSRTLRDFDEFSRSDRERYLQSSLALTDGDRSVGEWIAERYENLSRTAREIVPYGLNESSPQRAMLASAWAQAILLAGHASKWRRMSGQLADNSARSRLHKIFRSAVAAQVESTIVNVTIERRTIETTVESLYVRALLIDRFGGGNVPPKRLEILDSWLIAWMGSLWLSREPLPGAPMLAIDTNNPTRGLSRHIPTEPADFFLALKPLQRQLERATEFFHQGTIFPGWGIGLLFRMEEHVAVMDFIERELNMIENASAQKSKRFAVGNGARVTTFMGFNDVYHRALTAQTTLTSSLGLAAGAGAVRGTTTGAYVAPAALRLAALAQSSGMIEEDLTRSPVHLLDISDSGLGLEMSTEDAAKVELDELIAIRIEEGKPCVLGVVVRKVNVRNAYVTTVGVKVLTKVPLRATLEIVTDRTVRQNTAGIFVAGIGTHGFADSIIVTDAIYKARPTLSVTIASGMFHIRLGRVRHQGPGWKLAAVEVAEAR